MRSNNETSTAVTPYEDSPSLPVMGVGLLDNASSHKVEGSLKDVKIYFQLLKDNIEFVGGTASWDVRISSNRKEVIIRHIAFGTVSEVRFPYNAPNVKIYWVSFSLCNSVHEYFEFVQKGNVILSGQENEATPPTRVDVRL
jgi:hypothetical protein